MRAGADRVGRRARPWSTPWPSTSAPLGPLLTGRTIVMHAAGQDLEVFQHSVGVVPDDLFDTQIAASFLGMSSIGLAPLVTRCSASTCPRPIA